MLSLGKMSSQCKPSPLEIISSSICHTHLRVSDISSSVIHFKKKSEVRSIASRQDLDSVAVCSDECARALSFSLSLSLSLSQSDGTKPRQNGVERRYYYPSTITTFTTLTIVRLRHPAHARTCTARFSYATD